eukprot:scaffold2387_cov106-Amphora_coffeaeformis.AAC.3
MTPRSKSLAVKYHWFRSKLSPTTCMVIPAASADNHADIFTKASPIRSFRSTPQEHLRLLTCDFRLQLRANVRTHSSSIFVHMGSSISSHINNPVQDCYQTTPIYSLPMMRVISPTTDKCKGMFIMALLHYLLQCV